MFHRIIKDFMIQGGDPPWAWALVAPATSLRTRFTPSSPSPSPTCWQWLTQAPAPTVLSSSSPPLRPPWLNGRHTIFGEVTDEASKKVVDAIEGVETGFQDRPVKDVVISSIDIEKL